MGQIDMMIEGLAVARHGKDDPADSIPAFGTKPMSREPVMSGFWGRQWVYCARHETTLYPACPNLEDRAGIWKLLKPEEIGVQLTEGFIMDPEASVSALVFRHPDCTYFSVGAAAEP